MYIFFQPMSMVRNSFRDRREGYTDKAVVMRCYCYSNFFLSNFPCNIDFPIFESELFSYIITVVLYFPFLNVTYRCEREDQSSVTVKLYYLRTGSARLGFWYAILTFVSRVITLGLRMN